MKKALILMMGLIAASVSLFSCERTTSPLLSDYKGDYRFEVNWDNLPETLSVFSTYTIPFSVAGADTFMDFAVFTSCGDTLPHEITDSSLSFYTTGICTDSIMLEAIRPNLKKVIESHGCDIDAGRFITGGGKYAVDETAALRLTSSRPQVNFDSLAFSWYIRDSLIHTTTGIHEINLSKQSSSDTLRLWGYLEDNAGRKVRVDTVDVVFSGSRPQIKRIIFPSNFDLGDSILIKLQVADTEEQVSVSAFLLSGNEYADTLEIARRAIPTDSLISFYAEDIVVSDTGAKRLYVLVEDDGGLFEDTLSMDINTIFLAPTPSFMSSNRGVPAGISRYYYAPDNSGRTVKWVWYSGLNGVDTTGFDSLEITYEQALIDTLIVKGIDKYGYLGDPDTLYIKVTDDQYALFLDVDRAGWIKHPARAVARLAYSGEEKPDPVEYFWRVRPEGVIINEISDDTIDIIHDQASIVDIRVYAVVNGNDTTGEITNGIPFYTHAPKISLSDTSLSADIKTSVLCTVSVSDTNPGGEVSKIYRQINDSIDTLSPTDTVWDLSFSIPGEYELGAWVVDNDGFVSDSVHAAITIISSAPVVSGIDNPEIVYMNDTVDLVMNTTTAQNGGKITQYLWRLGETSADTVTDTNSIRWSFADSGIVKIYAACSDTFGQMSEERTKDIYVDPGFPSFSAELPDTVWINDEVICRISGRDTNGRVVEYAVSWDAQDGFVSQPESLFTYAYSSAGKKPVRIYVSDNDGFVSDTISDTVVVKAGMPSVTEITVNRAPGEIYILDTLEFTFAGRDSNDYVDSILVSWDGDTTFELREKVTDERLVYDQRFGRGDTGQTYVMLRVKDNDGLVKDSTVSITVKEGAPVIDSIAPDTVWVVDRKEYEIFAHDVNGDIDSFMVSFDMGDTWHSDTIAKFSHAWDTSESGVRSVIASVMDEDSVWSADTFEVTVRLGRPVLSLADFGDSIQVVKGQDGALDTMFFVYKGGNTYFAVDTTDINGQCVKFYWDFDDDGVNKVTDIPMWDQYLAKHTAHRMAAWCKDDDSISSEKMHFWIYPDEPPDTPSLGAPTIQGDSVKLVWENADFKDGESTEFQILCDTNNPQTTVVKDFGACKKSGNEFYYWFHPQAAGRYRYRVVAQDARQSKTTSLTSSYFDYP